MNYTQMYWTAVIILIVLLAIAATLVISTSDRVRLYRLRKKYGVHSVTSAEMQSAAHIWCAKESYSHTRHKHHMKAARELKAYAKLLGESK